MAHKRNQSLMRLLASILSTVLLCFSGVAEWTARTSNQYALLRKPTVSASQIAFSYGGDAKRLTSDVGIEIDPVFSPGGSMIAFTGEYDGNEDVYVIPATGGIPKRLTSLAGGEAVGWTRDGKRILFRSGRQSYSYFTQLYSVPVTGGLPDQLPLPMAVEGSSSPDSTELAYDFARS